MKKLTALLLCVAMLMVGVVAQAESGYEFLKSFFDDDIENLGRGTTVNRDSSSTQLTLIFDFSNNKIGLLGNNAKNNPVGTIWEAKSDKTFIVYLTTVCEGWGIIEENLDAGYSLCILLFLDDPDNPLIIDSEEDATTILEILQGA